MKDFSKKTLNQLSKKGISVISSTAIPGFEADEYYSGVAYNLSYNEIGFVRTHSQVIVLANSSWMPEIDLEPKM